MDDQQTYNEDLQRALEAFVSSSRFGFLKRLQIGRLIGADATSLGDLAELTFEALVDLGVERLEALSTVQKRVLVSTLFALSEGEAGAVGGEQDLDTPALNSVQVEIELREHIRALEQHPLFSVNREKKLGNFWDPAWERAPFEEAFTLGQLVKIDLATLQKKRSVGPSRVALLTRAVERVLAQLSGFDVVHTTDHKPSAKKPAARSTPQRSITLPVEEPRLHPWMLEASAFSIAEVAMLEYVLEQPGRPEVAQSPKSSLISSLATVFSASDIVLLAQLQEPPKPLHKKLKSWLAPYSEAAEISMLKEALQGPGVHLDKVLALLGLGEWSPSFARLVAVLILRAVGAQPVAYQGRECGAVYSLNPGLAQLIVTGLKAAGKSPAALSNLLKVACPAMDPFLHDWLCQAVKSAKRR